VSPRFTMWTSGLALDFCTGGREALSTGAMPP
jgi:hypothetical protein